MNYKRDYNGKCPRKRWNKVHNYDTPDLPEYDGYNLPFYNFADEVCYWATQEPFQDYEDFLDWIFAHLFGEARDVAQESKFVDHLDLLDLLNYYFNQQGQNYITKEAPDQASEDFYQNNYEPEYNYNEEQSDQNGYQEAVEQEKNWKEKWVPPDGSDDGVWIKGPGDEEYKKISELDFLKSWLGDESKLLQRINNEALDQNSDSGTPSFYELPKHESEEGEESTVRYESDYYENEPGYQSWNRMELGEFSNDEGVLKSQDCVNIVEIGEEHDKSDSNDRTLEHPDRVRGGKEVSTSYRGYDSEEDEDWLESDSENDHDQLENEYSADEDTMSLSAIHGDDACNEREKLLINKGTGASLESLVAFVSIPSLELTSAEVNTETVPWIEQLKNLGWKNMPGHGDTLMDTSKNIDGSLEALISFASQGCAEVVQPAADVGWLQVIESLDWPELAGREENGERQNWAHYNNEDAYNKSKDEVKLNLSGTKRTGHVNPEVKLRFKANKMKDKRRRNNEVPHVGHRFTPICRNYKYRRKRYHK